MAGVLSGLKALGLEKLEDSDIFAEEASEKAVDGGKKVVKEVCESDLIYDKEMKCPVCDRRFVTKIMKSSRAKLIGTDDDLRPRYEGIDSQKYEVILCENCGYAALGKNFTTILSSQAKLIKENICATVKLTKYNEPIYSFEQADERYKLALACAFVKKAKSSEKALICLKAAWLYRSKREELEAAGANKKEVDRLAENEKIYLENAYKGFTAARLKENLPIAGMDSNTLDYLLASLAFRVGDYANASKMVGTILTSSSNERIKNRARDLKDKLLAQKEATK